jgi:hypothetical protein
LQFVIEEQGEPLRGTLIHLRKARGWGTQSLQLHPVAQEQKLSDKGGAQYFRRLSE